MFRGSDETLAGTGTELENPFSGCLISGFPSHTLYPPRAPFRVSFGQNDMTSITFFMPFHEKEKMHYKKEIGNYPLCRLYLQLLAPSTIDLFLFTFGSSDGFLKNILSKYINYSQ